MKIRLGIIALLMTSLFCVSQVNAEDLNSSEVSIGSIVDAKIWNGYMRFPKIAPGMTWIYHVYGLVIFDTSIKQINETICFNVSESNFFTPPYSITSSDRLVSNYQYEVVLFASCLSNMICAEPPLHLHQYLIGGFEERTVPFGAFKALLVFKDDDTVDIRHEDEWYAQGRGLIKKVIDVRKSTPYYDRHISLTFDLVVIK